MTLINPTIGAERMLGNVDTHMQAIEGEHPGEFIQVHMAAAQVQATCALVHAVRELTEAVRALQPPPQRERTGKASL